VSTLIAAEAGIIKKKKSRTNALHLLEKQGIEFDIREYEVDEHDLSAEYVARKIGMPPERVFKTLVELRREELTKE